MTCSDLKLDYSFENREVAEKVLAEFHNVTKGDGVQSPLPCSHLSSHHD
jgi:hypothetical protein